MLSKIVKLSPALRYNGMSTKSQGVSGLRRYKKSLIFGSAISSLLLYEYTFRECETIGEFRDFLDV